jgi:phosphoribosylamine--glycine ligase
MAWRLAGSASVKKLYATPGNPGIARVAECISPSPAGAEDLARLAESLGADLTVVGPEAPLVAGAVDAFRARGLAIVGPTAAAARLEGSKVFAKEFMARAGIPTARFVTVDNAEEGVAAFARFPLPVVLKADGLAAGKGVVVARERGEAEQVLCAMLAGEYVGAAGRRVVIEECLFGEEVSFIVLSDGRSVAALEPTQDHKAVYDGDQGPNTGGMGAYCDSRIVSPSERLLILETIIQPVIERMAREGHPFQGFLYAGLMMTSEGPKVLEFNVRMGDPEAQPLMVRLEGDFADVLRAAARGDLAGARLTWKNEPSVCVVMASEGYPGTPRTGVPITGIEAAEATGATVFHAGTKLSAGGLVTAGGRVLGVTASGEDLAGAIKGAYAAVEQIRFEGAHYRRDIGAKGLRRWAATS